MGNGETVMVEATAGVDVGEGNEWDSSGGGMVEGNGGGALVEIIGREHW